MWRRVVRAKVKVAHTVKECVEAFVLTKEDAS